MQVNPSRDAYWKFGNTAVASTWYILARIEAQGLVKKGDRLWQIGKHILDTANLIREGLPHSQVQLEISTCNPLTGHYTLLNAAVLLEVFQTSGLKVSVCRLQLLLQNVCLF